jgi:hypothetical protein
MELKKIRLPLFLSGFAVIAQLPTGFAAEVFELGESNFAGRPGGKEADSIVGDFVTRLHTTL